MKHGFYSLAALLDGTETFRLNDAFGTYLYFKQKIRDRIMCVPHYVARAYELDYRQCPRFEGSIFDLNARFKVCTLRTLGDTETVEFNYPSHPSQIETIREEFYSGEQIDRFLTDETHIYLIRDADTGLTKIGSSSNPPQRLLQLKKQDTLLPKANDFRMIGHWCDHPFTESVLHREFEEKRVRGEWFDLTDRDVDNVREFARKRAE